MNTQRVTRSRRAVFGAAWARLLMMGLVFGLSLASWSAAEAGALFHTKPTTRASSGAIHVAPLVAKAKGAIFSLSYKYSYRRPRRYKRRYNRRLNRWYRRYRRYRTPPTAPDPFFRGAPPPGNKWIFRGRRKPRFGARARRHRGTGFVIHADGYALTSSRISSRARNLKAHFSSGKSYPAKVVGRVAALGMVLLRIQLPKGTKLPHLVLGSAKELQIGEPILALGRHGREGLQASTGILSSRGRHRRYGQILRTDASMYRSQRGGPLLNHQGLVIGLVRSGYSRRGGIAYPIDAIRKALPSLKSKGKLPRARLGVMIRLVTPDLMRAFKLPTMRGALVSQVMKGTAADRAGIKPGDLIVSFNGTPIEHFSTLPQVVRLASPGSTAKIVLWRNGKQMSVDVTLALWKSKASAKKAPTSKPSSRPAVRPAAPKTRSALSRLGLSVKSLAAEKAKKLGLSGAGVVLTQVKAGSASAENGLKAGDIVAEVNRVPVKSVAHFLSLVDKVPAGDSLLLLIRRNNTALFVAFTLP